MKKPMFMVFGMAELDPEDLHNIIADAVGEPRVNTNRGRDLRKDNGVPPKASGGNSDDGSPSESK